MPEIVSGTADTAGVERKLIGGSVIDGKFRPTWALPTAGGSGKACTLTSTLGIRFQLWTGLPVHASSFLVRPSFFLVLSDNPGGS